MEHNVPRIQLNIIFKFHINDNNQATVISRSFNLNFDIYNDKSIIEIEMNLH